MNCNLRKMKKEDRNWNEDGNRMSADIILIAIKTKSAKFPKMLMRLFLAGHPRELDSSSKHNMRL